jgi:hypothetical protein
LETANSTQDETLRRGKYIASSEELHLLVNVYNDTGHAAEVLDLLTTGVLGLKSIAGLDDPKSRRDLLLMALGVSGRWDDALLVIKDLIRETQADLGADDGIFGTALTILPHCSSAT